MIICTSRFGHFLCYIESGLFLLGKYLTVKYVSKETKSMNLEQGDFFSEENLKEVRDKTRIIDQPNKDDFVRKYIQKDIKYKLTSF